MLDLRVGTVQSILKNLLGLRAANDHTSCRSILVRRWYFARQRLPQTLQSVPLVYEIQEQSRLSRLGTSRVSNQEANSLFEL